MTEDSGSCCVPRRRKVPRGENEEIEKNNRGLCELVTVGLCCGRMVMIESESVASRLELWGGRTARVGKTVRLRVAQVGVDADGVSPGLS